MVVARDQPIAEADLHFVARRRVPCAVRRAVTDSRQGRPCRHRPVNTLMAATTGTEAVTARVRPIERHPQFHQAARRIPERPRPIPVQVIQQARRVTPKIILRLLADNILIRMHNPRRLILRARPRVTTSREPVHLSQTVLIRQLQRVRDLVEVPRDMIIVNADDTIDGLLHAFLDAIPRLQHVILQRVKRRLNPIRKPVDLRANRVIEPINNRSNNIVLNVAPDRLQTITQPLEPIPQTIDHRTENRPRSVAEPRHHRLNDLSLDEVPDNLHATPVGLELIAQPIDYPRNDRPRSIAEPIHHSTDRQLNGGPNNLHVQVIALKVASEPVDDLFKQRPRHVLEPVHDRTNRGLDPVPDREHNLLVQPSQHGRNNVPPHPRQQIHSRHNRRSGDSDSDTDRHPHRLDNVLVQPSGYRPDGLPGRLHGGPQSAGHPIRHDLECGLNAVPGGLDRVLPEPDGARGDNVPRRDHSRPKRATHPSPHNGSGRLNASPRRFNGVLVHPETGSSDSVPSGNHARPQDCLNPVPHHSGGILDRGPNSRPQFLASLGLREEIGDRRDDQADGKDDPADNRDSPDACRYRREYALDREARRRQPAGGHPGGDTGHRERRRESAKPNRVILHPLDALAQPIDHPRDVLDEPDKRVSHRLNLRGDRLDQRQHYFAKRDLYVVFSYRPLITK